MLKKSKPASRSQEVREWIKTITAFFRMLISLLILFTEK